ncbi:hypothetical protein [Cognatishimia sp. MH4019]|uniref:hypothetical protein n=1 Tax=Cognatishimia sp. MH4019 TaxID=2854030 RepID=UPI001CD1C3E1|nr:hypothetical protein [Cognatishimia sp. MH4019]
MNILLIETDPFVRTDMQEALRAAFPGVNLLSVETLDGGDFPQGSPQIIILDTPMDEVQTNQRIAAWIASGSQIVLTNGSSVPLSLPEGKWRKVDRPFTEQMLLDALDW